MSFEESFKKEFLNDIDMAILNDLKLLALLRSNKKEFLNTIRWFDFFDKNSEHHMVTKHNAILNGVK